MPKGRWSRQHLEICKRVVKSDHFLELLEFNETATDVFILQEVASDTLADLHRKLV
jgi:hypothetical protein